MVTSARLLVACIIDVAMEVDNITVTLLAIAIEYNYNTL